MIKLQDGISTITNEQYLEYVKLKEAFKKKATIVKYDEYHFHTQERTSKILVGQNDAASEISRLLNLVKELKNTVQRYEKEIGRYNSLENPYFKAFSLITRAIDNEHPEDLMGFNDGILDDSTHKGLVIDKFIKNSPKLVALQMPTFIVKYLKLLSDKRELVENYKKAKEQIEKLKEIILKTENADSSLKKK